MKAHDKDTIALHDADPQEPLFIQERGCEGPDLFPRPVMARLTPVEIILGQFAKLLSDVEDVPAKFLTSALTGIVRDADLPRGNGVTDPTKEGSDSNFARHGTKIPTPPHNVYVPLDESSYPL